MTKPYSSDVWDVAAGRPHPSDVWDVAAGGVNAAAFSSCTQESLLLLVPLVSFGEARDDVKRAVCVVAMCLGWWLLFFV